MATPEWAHGDHPHRRAEEAAVGVDLRRNQPHGGERAAGSEMPVALLRLQRSAGNRAVSQLVQARRTASPANAPAELAQRRSAGDPTGVVQREGGGTQTPVVQRGAVGTFFGRVGLGFVNATVGPFVNPKLWSDYFKTCDTIWNGRDADFVKLDADTAEALYGGRAMRILQLAKETTNQVATVTTALALVFTLLGAAPFLQPFAAVGTVCGMLAAIAHAVTLVLRGVTAARDWRKMRNLRKASPLGAATKETSMLRAKLMGEIGGMVSNAIGVIGGGLGGSFTALGGLITTGAVPGSVSSVFGSGAQAMSGVDSGITNAASGGFIGQTANSTADVAASIGQGLGDRESKNQGRLPSSALRTDLPKVDDEPPASGSADRGDEQLGLEIEQKLRQVVPQVTTLTGRESAKGKQEVSNLGETGSSISVVSAQVPGMTGGIADLGSNAAKLNEAGDAASEKVASKKKVDKAEVVKAEEAVKKAEEEAEPIVGPPEPQVEDADLSDDDTEDSSDLSGYEADDEATPKRDALPVRRSALPGAGPRDSQSIGVVRVQRGIGDQVKGFFGSLAGRFMSSVKRARKLWQKFRTKITQAVLKAMGLEPTAQELGRELGQARADLPSIVQADQAANAQAEQAKAGAEELQDALRR